MSSNSENSPDAIMVSDSGAVEPFNGVNTSPDAQGEGNSSAPKPKRLACMICRKRKLKCDGNKPSCSTCTRLRHTCAYDEVRRKSGPKRGYVKALEERLKQVETLLQRQETTTSTPDAEKAAAKAPEPAVVNQPQRPAATPNFNNLDVPLGMANGQDGLDQWQLNDDSPQAGTGDDFNFNGAMPIDVPNVEGNFTWEMIGLGLEEPLPPQATIDELHQIYFDKIHPSSPMIHKSRYLAAMNLSPTQRPPVCLRYAMWTLACSVTDKFHDLKDLFYKRARKYVESDYVKGYGEHLISVAHAQTHVLLAMYEFKWMYFPRAWMSTGSAVRLCQMMGLHRLDGAGLDVKQCLTPPRDWTEQEERRRTFWMAFSEDRYASIGTGWPMTVDERDILTNLPSSEEAFEASQFEPGQTLTDAMSPAGAAKLSPFGGIVLMACLFGRNLIHLHRPDPDDRDHDLNGEFWKRHRGMDNILLNTSLCLPASLKLPNGLGNPNIIFTNMCIYTSTICLHQAAIFKADKNKLPNSVSAESKVRCITAANEIASIMRMISHLELATMNPFISFCLYVSARVFVQYLKSRPDDSQTADSLRFLLSAMSALKRRNPLTESFLVQLDVDLEALGARIPKLKSAFPRNSHSPGPNMPPKPKIFEGHKEPYRGDFDPDSHCEPTESDGGGLGIMQFRDDTDFLQPADNSNGARVSPSGNMGEVDSSMHGTMKSAQEWSRGDSSSTQDRLAFMPPAGNYAVPTPQIHGYSRPPEMDGSSTNDLSTSSADGNRRTPNSSSASENRQTLAPGGAMTSSGRNSFNASPAGSHQNLTRNGSHHNDMGRGLDDSFFNASSVYGMPSLGSGLTLGQSFGIPGGGATSTGFTPSAWSNMDSQGDGGMGSTSDGVLQSIMTMGPMETMDLNWNPQP